MCRVAGVRLHRAHLMEDGLFVDATYSSTSVEWLPLGVFHHIQTDLEPLEFTGVTGIVWIVRS